MRGDGGQQRPFNLAAGDILGMKDAAVRVATLTAKVELEVAAILPLGELHAELDQFLDAGRALLHNATHNCLVAKLATGVERIAHVALERVLLARDGGDSALSVVGVGLSAVLFGDDRDGAGVGDLESKRQTGDATA